MGIGSMLVRPEPASASLVRREIAKDLELQRMPSSCIEDIALVVTELFSNAVLHARKASDQDLGVAWDADATGVTVRVDDHCPEAPQPRTADHRAVNGRGLAIVASLACEWGVVSNGDGKQVWARVAVPAASYRQSA